MTRCHSGAYSVAATSWSGYGAASAASTAASSSARVAVARARTGDGPTLLECRTYRHYGHSKSDPGAYRPPEEVERWLARDPLNITRARLVAEGVAEEAIDAVEEATRAELEAAVEAALAAPYPDPEVTATEYAPL